MTERDAQSLARRMNARTALIARLAALDRPLTPQELARWRKASAQGVKDAELLVQLMHALKK